MGEGVGAVELPGVVLLIHSEERYLQLGRLEDRGPK